MHLNESNETSTHKTGKKKKTNEMIFVLSFLLSLDEENW